MSEAIIIGLDIAKAGFVPPRRSAIRRACLHPAWSESRRLCGHILTAAFSLTEAETLRVTSDRFAMSARCPLLPRAHIPLRFAQQLRKLHHVRGDAPRFVAREQVRCRAAARFILEVHVDKFLIVSVFHDETGVRFFNDPWWRKAAGR